MAGITVQIDYSVNGDLLWLGNGVPNTDSAQNVTFEPDFDAFFSVDGKCVGVYLFDAARILLPPLTVDSTDVKFNFKELSGVYSRDTDTLTIGNGNAAASDREIAKGLTARYDDTDKVAGFTLERAAELLLPHLETWRPWTNEEMEQIQKRMAEHDAVMRQRVAASDYPGRPL